MKSADGLHDLLLRLGDLSEYEIARRIEPQAGDAAGDGAGGGTARHHGRRRSKAVAQRTTRHRVARAADVRRASGGGAGDVLTELSDALEMATRRRAAARLAAELVRERRAVKVTIAGEPRLVAVEDAARYRDALGTPLPLGLPESLLAPVRDPLGDLLMRYARSHGPFTAAEIAGRFGLGRSVVEPVLRRLVGVGRLLEGDFRPGGTEREWCEPGVLGQIRRRSLAKLRSQVEPVEPAVLGRLRHHVAGPDASPQGPRRAARRHRNAARRAAAGIARRIGNPARAHRGLSALGPRRAARRRRSRLVRPRTARRTRRPRRALPDRSLPAPVASARARHGASAAAAVRRARRSRTRNPRPASGARGCPSPLKGRGLG